jgi:hypothetical protein
MSDLESHASPLLLDMAFGQQRTLSEDEQLLLAGWAAKTTLIFQLTHPPNERTAEATHFHRLHANSGRFPPGGFVWLTRYDPADVRGHYICVNLWPFGRLMEGPPVAFASVLTLLQVAFIVFMHDVSDPVTVSITESDAGASIAQLFPPSGVVEWPFQRPVSLNALQGTLNRFVS